MGVCTKERKGVPAEVVMATPCTNSLGGESGGTSMKDVGGAGFAGERRWFVLKRPRCDKNGESENEVTVTSKQHAQRGRGIEKVKY